MERYAALEPQRRENRQVGEGLRLVIQCARLAQSVHGGHPRLRVLRALLQEELERIAGSGQTSVALIAADTAEPIGA
jgi:hypothetical protein